MNKPTIDLRHVRDVVAVAEASLGPVEKAGILPGEAYTSPGFWEFEKQAIFAKEWLCIAHVNEIPNPGDYIQLTVMEEPVIVARDEAGEVHALSAVCQHRGHPIVGGVKDAPPGKCLNARRLVCPYHTWAYGMDGTLQGAPSMEETVPLEELRKNNSLPRIRMEIFHGLVFISFDADVPPVAQKLGKLDDEFRGYGLAELVPGSTFVQQGLEWNWKLHHENALEPYHTSYVHSGYHNAVPSNLTRFYPIDPQEGQVFRTTGFAGDDGDLFEIANVRRLPSIPGLSEEQRGRVFFVSILPCVVAVLEPTMVTITFLSPTGADRLDSRRVNLYPRAAAEVSEFPQICGEHLEKVKVIVGQDAVTQMALQRAYQSQFKPRGRFSHLETAISQLNDWMVCRYRDGLARLEQAQARPLPREAGSHA
ncbi:MAG: aromatic ring-hydroxylating dioxygenase subunit alpha [Pantoea sp.]|uniref:aromatic ring-hydroxylating oxygenase subunit alpha n=1 Tax=Pantoea sp. TaxID=69393 RepID=UPI00239DF9D5|nr:aromatic ring-hydroxylating dioxygenase subunit alpha [Pantoea sp.]MDE1186864.1 aromatic ring-hydroxylating dioxygenase subunit alpha [Pantoea sp.]